MEKKGFFLVLLALLALPGCWKKDEKAQKSTKKVAQNKVDIPLADDSIRSFFDDDLGEFALVEDDAIQEGELIDQIAQVGSKDDFAWVQDEQQENIKVVYFDFDKYVVREDQQESVEYDIKQVQEVLKKAAQDGDLPTVVIEGHACHSAGSSTYNLALSERRAKIVSDWFTSAGIPKENVKIVGRGSEVPALDTQGKEVTGDRQAQWPNRRAEVRIVYS